MNKNWKEKRIFKLVYALYSFIENVKYQRKRCMLCNVHVLRTRSSTWRPPREPDTTTIILHPYGDLLWGMVLFWFPERNRYLPTNGHPGH